MKKLLLLFALSIVTVMSRAAFGQTPSVVISGCQETPSVGCTVTFTNVKAAHISMRNVQWEFLAGKDKSPASYFTSSAQLHLDPEAVALVTFDVAVEVSGKVQHFTKILTVHQRK